MAGESPLPPSSGVRLRALHLARQLATAFDVEVLALGSVPQDLTEPFTLTGAPHSWRRSGPLLRSLRRPYMAAKLDSKTARALAADAAPATAQAELPFLVPVARSARAPIVLDAHNVETELLETLAVEEPQAAQRLRWRWEAGKTERFERAVVRTVEAVCATSDEDAAVFERWGAQEIVVVPNGVDPSIVRYQEPGRSSLLLYVGNYGYRPNMLAARELVEQILPLVQISRPDAAARLVGLGSDGVTREQRPDVEGTGEVKSTLPHLHAAGALVVPLRAGSGTRLKILEGLAAGVPIVATPLAVAGLRLRDGEHVLLADTSAALAAQVVRLLDDPDLSRGLAAQGRAFVEQTYAWDVVARPLLELHARLGASR